MAPFIDSHAHLADPAFDADRNEVIDRARVTGAQGIVAIGESLAAADRAQAIAALHPDFVWWTAGVHPHDAAGFDAVSDAARIREHLDRGAVAVGECGLDYHYDHSPKQQQRRAFADQLAIAAQAKRPVIVHSRQAVDDTIAMVNEAGRAQVTGVLHCFTGPLALAEAALAAGWYLSFSGVVTFKKFADDDLIKLADIGRVLIETDAPYLTPVPHRGKRNEPAYASLTLARVAAARGVTAEVMGAAVCTNARRLFGLASG